MSISASIRQIAATIASHALDAVIVAMMIAIVIHWVGGR